MVSIFLVLFLLVMGAAAAPVDDQKCQQCCKSKLQSAKCIDGVCQVGSLRFNWTGGIERCNDSWTAIWDSSVVNSYESPTGECGGHGTLSGKYCNCWTTFDYPSGLTTRWTGVTCSNSYATTYLNGVLTEVGVPATASANCTNSSCSQFGAQSICAQDGSCICPTFKTNLTIGQSRGLNHTVFYGRKCNYYYYFWRVSDFDTNPDTTQNSSLRKYNDVYCYCNISQSGSCTPRCEPLITCNGHGKCGTDSYCQCDNGFAAPWCHSCKTGFAGPNCSSCASDWFPKSGEKKCTTYCNANDSTAGCSGHGTCNENGQCVCHPRFAGELCARCASSSPLAVYDMQCQVVCNSSTKCTGKGFCNMTGGCVCVDGWSGADCNTVTASRAAAASGCEGRKSATLSVIIAVLVTLVVMGLAFAAYKLWEAKRGGQGQLSEPLTGEMKNVA